VELECLVGGFRGKATATTAALPVSRCTFDSGDEIMSAQLSQIRQASGTVSNNLLFAYGANMNLAQIKERCSHPVRVSAACLRDYRIGFYGHSEKWDGALETAIEARGCQLWGVLFALNALDWDQLDLWQDARFDGAGQYFHYPVQVCDSQGKCYEARLYKKDVLNAPCPPSEPYMARILDGARQNKLPPAYIEILMAIETARAHYAVPVRTGMNFTIAASASCADCDGIE
jgi:hypothetical protein